MFKCAIAVVTRLIFIYNKSSSLRKVNDDEGHVVAPLAHGALYIGGQEGVK